MAVLQESIFKKILLITGILLIIGGVAGGYYFVYEGIKPAFLQLKVFTFYSQYLDTRFFTLITNNQADELAVTSYWLGWLLVVYSKDGSLLNRHSLFILFNIFGYLFFHGVAILYFAFVSLFLSPLFFYKFKLNLKWKIPLFK